MSDKRPKSPSTKRSRPSGRALAEHADRILADALERANEYERQGFHSATIPRADLIAKLSGRTAHSPFITQVGWGNAVRGATFVLDFGLMNPDPFPYEIGNLGLCFCYADAGALSDPGMTLVRAEPSVGIVQVEIGTLNGAPTAYYLDAIHTIPATFRTGPADLDYFLYQPDPFAAGVLLERGTIRIDVA